MMTYFKETSNLTDEEIFVVSDMTGKMMRCVLEGKSIDYMAEKLHLEPHQVKENIFEAIYDFKKVIGWKLYLKLWFHKRCWK